MSFLLKQVFSFVKLLNSDTGTNQIATGIACGLILGFAPSFSLQTILVFLCIFFFRVQAGAAFVSAIFFKIIAYFLDPAFDTIGGNVLEMEGLRSVFTMLYNLPIIPLTRFNNSVVMGAGVVALALALPIFFLSKKLIAVYRETIVIRFKKSTICRVIKANSLYQWYEKYEQFRN